MGRSRPWAMLARSSLPPARPDPRRGPAAPGWGPRPPRDDPGRFPGRGLATSPPGLAAVLPPFTARIARIIGRRFPGGGLGLHRSATPRFAVPGDPDGPPRRPPRVTATDGRSAPEWASLGHETPSRPPPHSRGRLRRPPRVQPQPGPPGPLARPDRESRPDARSRARRPGRHPDRVGTNRIPSPGGACSDRSTVAAPTGPGSPASPSTGPPPATLTTHSGGTTAPFTYVTIADVAHAVPAGGIIDLEARDRVVTRYRREGNDPMLPGGLAEDNLSLLSGRARRAVTFAIALSADLRVTSLDIFRSLLENRGRLSYARADRVIDGSADSPCRGPLLACHELSGRLLARPGTPGPWPSTTSAEAGGRPRTAPSSPSPPRPPTAPTSSSRRP